MDNNKKGRRKAKLAKYFGRMITVRGMTEMALLVAMAVVLDLPFAKIKFSVGPSFSLTMLPLFIIALRFPVLDSFLGIGVVYGLTTMFLDAPEFGFLNFPLDYLIGYGAIAITSLFQGLIFHKYRQKVFNFLVLGGAVILSILTRTFSSTLSGVILYKATFWASVVINAPGILMSGAMVLVLLIFLFPSVRIFLTPPETEEAVIDN